MNYSMIKIVEVLSKVFIEIITEILECIILSFLSKNQASTCVVIFKAYVKEPFWKTYPIFYINGKKHYFKAQLVRF